MLSNFFQLGSIPPDQMTGVYDIRLVILSYFVATIASYIALDLTGRLRDMNNTTSEKMLWLAGGAFAMGGGIWSMHFIGMLAFSMPHMQMTYNPFWTVLSLIVAILASCFALLLLQSKKIKVLQFILGGIILGLAIATMHYMGMYAMTDVMNIRYLPGLFALSIVIAILASEAALWLAIKSTQVPDHIRFRLKFISAFIMGAAICGMHYTGMFAAVFTFKNAPMVSLISINPNLLAVNIAGITFLLLGIAVLVSMHKESQNRQLLATARQAGMAEVATSVLHNVGNVLNSVNISATMIDERIRKSKLSEFQDLSQLIYENKDHFSEFVGEDARGKMLPEYIHQLSKYIIDEREFLLKETSTLLKNIAHIKNVVGMQQNLSKKTKTMEQITEVDKLLEEALTMTGIEANHPDIIVIKKYEFSNPVVIDANKFLQILVNLLKNAKDSLRDSKQLAKKITIEVSHNEKRFFVHISDNGGGIGPDQMTKIFSYGFTTKKEGHGFGLHASALAAKELGGVLSVTSEGVNQGATFILDMPLEYPK